MVRTPLALVLLQFPLSFGALMAAMFYPPAGSAAVLITPGESSAAHAINWARAHDAALLGLAADGQTPVVRLSGDANALAAIAAGFIPLAADLATCGTAPQSMGIQK